VLAATSHNIWDFILFEEKRMHAMSVVRWASIFFFFIWLRLDQSCTPSCIHVTQFSAIFTINLDVLTAKQFIQNYLKV
jgi:hypothetical protein